MLKLVRITTALISLDKLLVGQPGYMQHHGFDVYMISSPGSESDHLVKRESSKFLPVKMTRTISPIRDLASLFKLVWLLRKMKPAIVHTHTPKAGLLGMLAAWITNVPVRLHTVAGLPLMEATGGKRKLLELIEKITYACAVQVYPNSKNLSSFILDNSFCNAAKVKVLGNGSSNGINTQYFATNNELETIADRLRNELLIKTTDFVFVFIGRVVKDKGIQELVQAFRQLTATHQHVKLLLVGPYEPELDPISDETSSIIENDANIVHVGYQSDVRPYLAISTALAFPSYREGFPNVPMQAGCFELPCVVTDINGCNEIIEHEVNGLIIPPKDTAALHRAMERLVTDKVLYAKLKSHARAMIVERYEQTYFWSLLLEEYKEQLNKHGLIL